MTAGYSSAPQHVTKILNMLLNTELLCDHGLNLTDNRWVL